jgi:hypothetical protein
MFELPLTQRVSFRTRMQKRNRLQVSKYIRWRFKLEPDQYLKATVVILGVLRSPQTFLTRTSKDGRIVIPQLNMSLIQKGKMDFSDFVVEVTLEPF